MVDNERRKQRGEVQLVSREVKTMATISRTVGGCRTSDLHALDWQAMYVVEFATVEVARPKVDNDPKLRRIYVSALHTLKVNMRDSMDLADHGSEATRRKYDTLAREPMKRRQVVCLRCRP